MIDSKLRDALVRYYLRTEGTQEEIAHGVRGLELVLESVGSDAVMGLPDDLWNRGVIDLVEHQRLRKLTVQDMMETTVDALRLVEMDLIPSTGERRKTVAENKLLEQGTEIDFVALTTYERHETTTWTARWSFGNGSLKVRERGSPIDLAKHYLRGMILEHIRQNPKDKAELFPVVDGKLPTVEVPCGVYVSWIGFNREELSDKEG